MDWLPVRAWIVTGRAVALAVGAGSGGVVAGVRAAAFAVAEDDAAGVASRGLSSVSGTSLLDVVAAWSAAVAADEDP
jgi:hypothetical protein